MGEARRRRRLQEKELAKVRPYASRGELPPDMMADFFKGIAWQLGGLEFRGLPEVGGKCVFKTLAAYQAVRACGIDTHIGLGGLVVRIGPDERRDVVAFCGPRNMGTVVPGKDCGTAFHCWLRYRDWIFDASVGEWRCLDPVASEMRAWGEALEPPQWTVTLPRYWLKRSDEVELAWRPEGTPALGEAWYGPFRGDANAVMDNIRAIHREVGGEIAKALARIFNAYCERKGIDREHDDTVYPLKFIALQV